MTDASTLTLLFREAAALLPFADTLRIEQTETQALLSVQTTAGTWFAALPGQHITQPGAYSIPARRALWAIADAEEPLEAVRFDPAWVEFGRPDQVARIRFAPAVDAYPEIGGFTASARIPTASLAEGELPTLLAAFARLDPVAPGRPAGIAVIVNDDAAQLAAAHPRLVLTRTLPATADPRFVGTGTLILSADSSRLLTRLTALWHAASLPEVEIMLSADQVLVTRRSSDPDQPCLGAFLAPASQPQALGELLKTAAARHKTPVGIPMATEVLEKIRKMPQTTDVVAFDADGMIRVKPAAQVRSSAVHDTGHWALRKKGLPTAVVAATALNSALGALDGLNPTIASPIDINGLSCLHLAAGTSDAILA